MVMVRVSRLSIGLWTIHGYSSYVFYGFSLLVSPSSRDLSVSHYGQSFVGFAGIHFGSTGSYSSYGRRVALDATY